MSEDKQTNTASGTQTYASYIYDLLGQLTYENTLNAAQKKYIKYDVTGKVVMVSRNATFTQPVVEYVYDELGQRIIKKLYNASYVHIQNTYYAGDVIYTQPVTGGVGGTITAQEYEIDGGSGRIGIYYRPSTTYAYQLTDHLGNVRAVVAKNGTTLQVRLYNDYYPYGMVITPQTTGTNDYRYGYQGQYAEKDPETDWNAFELRMYDAKIARWLSVDPKGQFHSPYVSMGNNPITGVDPDGGFSSWLRAFGYWLSHEGGKISKNEYGEWSVRRANVEVNAAGETIVTSYLEYGEGRHSRSASFESLANDQAMMADIQVNGEKSLFKMYDSPTDAGWSAMSIGTGLGLSAMAPALKGGATGANAAKGGSQLLLKPGAANLTQKGLDHIVARHWFTSGAKGAGKFAEGTTGAGLKSMINTTTTQGAFRANTMGRAGTIAEYNFGRVIGTTSSGAPASSLRVVIGTNGNVITAFPF